MRNVTRNNRLHDDDAEADLDSQDELLLDEVGVSQLATLRREKLQLLDKVAELEAETIASRARAQELQSELAALSALRSGLEDRLRAGFEAEAGTILAPGAHRIQPIEPTVPTSPRTNGATAIGRSKDSAFASVASGQYFFKFLILHA